MADDAETKRTRVRETLERLDMAMDLKTLRHAKGELTPEETARMKFLNAKWDTGRPLSRAENDERSGLNAIHARAPTPAPPKVEASPVAPARNVKKQLDALRTAVTDVVAKEISAHRHEREIQSAKIEAALARLDAALARAEAGTRQ